MGNKIHFDTESYRIDETDMGIRRFINKKTLEYVPFNTKIEEHITKNCSDFPQFTVDFILGHQYNIFSDVFERHSL